MRNAFSVTTRNANHAFAGDVCAHVMMKTRDYRALGFRGARNDERHSHKDFVVVDKDSKGAVKIARGTMLAVCYGIEFAQATFYAVLNDTRVVKAFDANARVSRERKDDAKQFDAMTANKGAMLIAKFGRKLASVTVNKALATKLAKAKDGEGDYDLGDDKIGKFAGHVFVIAD